VASVPASQLCPSLNHWTFDCPTPSGLGHQNQRRGTTRILDILQAMSLQRHSAVHRLLSSWKIDGSIEFLLITAVCENNIKHIDASYVDVVTNGSP
jgi:hypothetical protein